MNSKLLVTYLLRILDPLLGLALFPAAMLMKLVRTAGVHRLPFCKTVLLKIGVFPVRNHYYEPQFSYEGIDSKSFFGSARSLPGIQWDIDAQLELLSKLTYEKEISGTATGPTSGFSDYLNNPNFGSGDGEFLYQMIRHYKPKQIIEIGSGYSTRIAVMAVDKNKAETAGLTCSHTCVEPFEMPWLESIGVKVIRKPVETVDVSVFEALEAGDLLFIDSSHMIRPTGDVLYEYLQLLPRLKSGVIVHIHDIFSPYDYPESWLQGEVRFWNEQYLLEAFLTENDQWKILSGLNFLHKNHSEAFSRVCPYSSPDRNPGSFYMQKK